MWYKFRKEGNRFSVVQQKLSSYNAYLLNRRQCCWHYNILSSSGTVPKDHVQVLGLEVNVDSGDVCQSVHLNTTRLLQVHCVTSVEVCQFFSLCEHHLTASGSVTHWVWPVVHWLCRCHPCRTCLRTIWRNMLFCPQSSEPSGCRWTVCVRKKLNVSTRQTYNVFQIKTNNSVRLILLLSIIVSLDFCFSFRLLVTTVLFGICFSWTDVCTVFLAIVASVFFSEQGMPNWIPS